MDWRDEFINAGLTFCDVSLRPQYSRLLTRAQKDGGPNTRTKLTPKIELAIPIISANMDTVTESAMATAMARFGGIGIIHRNCSIAAQVAIVRRVKSAEDSLIKNPYTLSGEDSVSKARELFIQKEIDSILIIDERKRLIGLITKYEIARASADAKLKKYMRPRKELIVIEKDPPPDAQEARKIAEKTFAKHPLLGKLPFVNREDRLLGLLTKKDLFQFASFPNATKDSTGKLRVGAAIGVDKFALERAGELINAGVDVLVLDIAHGHSQMAMEMAKSAKRMWPGFELIVGNVATKEAVRDYVRLGADAVKVGIGPGATCSTRIVSGAGVPQVSAILECAREAEKTGTFIIADGGVRYPRDITIAIACGASSVMIGTLFAGTDESPGDIIRESGKNLKIVRGMSSLDVNLEIKGAKFLEAGIFEAIEPEGETRRVAYNGPLNRVLGALVSGLRSGMTYVGAATIKELRRPFNEKFTRMSQAAWEESRPHNVDIF